MIWKSYHAKDATEKFLFRFLSVKHLEDFLDTGSIWFSRADRFGDKMECVKLLELRKPKPNFESIEKRKKRFLISCWHLANKETIALWDTYSDTIENRRKVAIRFKRKNLVQLMQDSIFRNNNLYYKTQWVHGQVQYKSLINARPETLDQSLMKHSAFRKEAAFKYENEYRFVIELKKEAESLGINYNIGSPRNLEFDILINPLLNKEEYLFLKNTISEKGFSNNVKDSDLAKWLKPELW